MLLAFPDTKAAGKAPLAMEASEHYPMSDHQHCMNMVSLSPPTLYEHGLSLSHKLPKGALLRTAPCPQSTVAEAHSIMPGRNTALHVRAQGLQAELPQQCILTAAGYLPSAIAPLLLKQLLG